MSREITVRGVVIGRRPIGEGSARISLYTDALGLVSAVAKSAREAIEIFPRFKPDVLVSDIAMPDEDGYALIKKIRSFGKKHGGQVPAVAMTAYAGAEDIERALSAGFQVHLAKPFDADHFAEVIAKVSGR